MKKPLALLLLTVSLVSAAEAEEWPKPVTTIVVGLGPGSALDIVARIFAKGLQVRLGTTFVVDNKPGAGGNLAVGLVSRAEPDGATMLLAHSGNILINPMMMDVSCDPLKCLRPVSMLATTPSVFVANKKLGVKTMGDLVDLLKRNPGKYNYAMLGPGSSSNLAYEVIASTRGTQVVQVPYRSTPEIVRALLSGDVDFAMPVISSVEPSIQQGALDALAISSASRWKTLPNVPTTGEAGFPSIPLDVWNGLFVPANTPKSTIAKIESAVRAVASDEENAAQIRRLSYTPVGSTSEKFSEEIHAEKMDLMAIMKRAGLLKAQ